MTYVKVTHPDGRTSGPLTHNEAFQYVLDKQGQSYDYATKHGGWSVDEVEVRRARVRNRSAHDLTYAERAMPSNYRLEFQDGVAYVVGYDVAGWTLEDYVIPRLASGLVWAEEVT